MRRCYASVQRRKSIPACSVSLDILWPTHDNGVPHELVVVDRAHPHGHAEEEHEAGDTMASALDGITVLDLTDGPAGALATMLLCDHGARVIRVLDIHDTVPRRGGYLVWDRGKECVQVDLSRMRPTPQRSGSHATAGPTASEDSTAFYARLIH